MKYRLIALVLLASAIYGCGTRHTTEEAASDSGFTSDENGVTVIQDSPLSAKLTLSEVTAQILDIQLRTTASVGYRSGSVAEIGLPFGGRVIRSFVRLDYLMAVRVYNDTAEQCIAARTGLAAAAAELIRAVGL